MSIFSYFGTIFEEIKDLNAGFFMKLTFRQFLIGSEEKRVWRPSSEKESSAREIVWEN